jgi:hypothetical protein
VGGPGRILGLGEALVLWGAEAAVVRLGRSLVVGEVGDRSSSENATFRLLSTHTAGESGQRPRRCSVRNAGWWRSTAEQNAAVLTAGGGAGPDL